MRHHQFVGCSMLSAILLIGFGCAPRKPAPELTDLPPSITYLATVKVDEQVFQAPPGQIRVFTTTRAALDAARRAATDDFDNSAHPLFYMGSDAGWDYDYLADHAFGMFFRVAREENRQDDRMQLTGNSLAWREVKPTAGATTRKS